MGVDQSNKVLIAGAYGMVGQALRRSLTRHGFQSLLTPTRAELDLLNQRATFDYLAATRPDVVIVAAAKVGGIHANNTYPADFLYENLAIASHLIQGSFEAKVPRLLFLGSSCIYPKNAPQPMREDCLLTSSLEPTNEAYAIAKIAGLKLCEAIRKQHGVTYHSAMPTNLYGPGDNYHPENSHVIPGLMRRFHEAKERGAEEVVSWGTGTPRREFLHVDDLADGCLHLLNLENPPDWANIGAGTDVTIRELTELMAETVGFKGKVSFDPSKPDGTPRKWMDSSRIIATGWKPAINLREGLKSTYQTFLTDMDQGALRAQ